MNGADKGHWLLAASLFVSLVGCTTLPPTPTPAGSTPPTTAPTATAAPQPPGPAPNTALRPFNELIRDAKLLPGLFRLYQREERVLLELEPQHFKTPYLLAITLSQGLGERSFYSHFMWDDTLVTFERVGANVQMQVRNVSLFATPGTAMAINVANSFSPSLLNVVPVLSQPHPERQSILVDASALFLADMPQAATRLEAAFRIPYAFDARNSVLDKVRSTPDMATFQVRAHFYTPRLPLQQPSPNSPPVAINPPRTLEDPRSLFLGFHYSLATLPDAEYRPRAADDRLGHFVTQRWNYSDDVAIDPRQHWVNRWRLEKQQPEAASSEPKKPIIFWIDKNVPEKYRATITAGILEWNKAFERVGFKQAIRVEIQPEQAEFDLADVRHASVRWYLEAEERGLARGPIVADPRTGEIIDADITISQSWTRLMRRVGVEAVPAAPRLLKADHDQRWCEHAAMTIEDTAFALDLMEARGELLPDSPEVEKILLMALKDVVMHEVGHTLGLRHNFRASSVYSLQQISDPAFNREYGVSGSVMDYNPINLAPRGLPQGEYFMTTLGAYDYWVIEYAYRPLPADQEKSALEAIARRSTEPALAYATDDEAGGFGNDGYDPSVHRFDLGNDGLAYAKRRLQLGQELLTRLQQLPATSLTSTRLRRGTSSALNQIGNAATLALKYVGGVQYFRDRPDSARANFVPIPLVQQKEALLLLKNEVFSTQALNLPASFIARLAPDNFERSLSPPELPGLTNTLFEVQRRALERALSDATAQRLIDSALLVPAPNALGLSDLYSTLRKAIWSELDGGQDIVLPRRNLQREHVRRLAALLLRPTQNTPADARALARVEAQSLLTSLTKAKTLSNAALSAEARAHLSESQSTLREALRASLQRGGA
ncbi:MAG: zinc-dependent metalloprotease [Burkholderiales bacterium]|nr:zinc-dependent metalloprotease [Burkholderiales bacterium]MCA3153454.1 zinc-dependent metalloprotease [Burkholderiales bacterium]